MSDVEEHAKAAVDAFQDAFNAQDHERLAAALNYPHVRLWSGVFTQIETPEEFAEISQTRAIATRGGGLASHHDGLSGRWCRRDPPDKAHCALINHRISPRRRLRSVYHKFDTLWIITKQDGHWGVKFRSSFLCISLALTAVLTKRPPVGARLSSARIAGERIGGGWRAR